MPQGVPCTSPAGSRTRPHTRARGPLAIVVAAPHADARKDRQMLRALTSAWLSEPRGRLVLAAWVATFSTVTIRALYLRRRAKKAPPPPAKAPAAAASKPPSAFRGVLRLAAPSWRSRPVAWAGVLSVGIGLRLVVSLKMSREIGVLGSLLAQRRWPELFRRQLGYAVYALPAALLTALQKYAASQLGLAMRYHLSAAVHARYGASASLPLAVAGADDALQIGTADVAAFCRESVSLFEGLLKPTAEVVISSTVLASQMGTGPLLRCYLFFGAAGCWTRLVGPAIATRTADVQAAEGELLAAHARLVAYAEEVAMLRGGAAERALLDGALDHLAASTATLQLQRFGSEALDGYVLRYLGILAAFTAMMPAVYHASTAAGANDPTEYFLTCLHLLVNVGMACKDLVLSHKALAGARGMAGRVRLLLDALDTAAVAPPAAGVRRLTAAPGAPCVALAALSVGPPGGAALLRALDLRVFPGDRLLITGPNGAGKTSLLRVLAGVWAAHGGTATLPPAEHILFLPQRPYLLPAATPKQQLLYPAAAPPAGASERDAEWAPEWAVADSELVDVFRRGARRCRLTQHPRPLPVRGRTAPRRVVCEPPLRCARIRSRPRPPLRRLARAPRDGGVGGPLAGRDAARLDRPAARAPPTRRRPRRADVGGRARLRGADLRRARRVARHAAHGGAPPGARGVPHSRAPPRRRRRLFVRDCQQRLRRVAARRRRRLACDDVSL